MAHDEQGSASDRATRPENFRPGEKFNFEPGTRPGLEIQPRNRPGIGNPARHGKTRKYRNFEKVLNIKFISQKNYIFT